MHTTDIGGIYSPERRSASVLARKRIIDDTPFRHENICRNGIPLRSDSTTVHHRLQSLAIAFSALLHIVFGHFAGRGVHFCTAMLATVKQCICLAGRVYNVKLILTLGLSVFQVYSYEVIIKLLMLLLLGRIAVLCRPT